MIIQRVTTAGLLAGLLLFAGAAPEADEDRLVYADFETIQDGRPVSARGGFVQLVAYQENNIAPSTFKGMDGATPAAPSIVRTSKESENTAAAWEYDLKAPNQWAGVGIEIKGRPDEGGKPSADDVSGYEALMLQVFSQSPTADTLPVTVRIEFISRGFGFDLDVGYPQTTFRARPGFHTYRVPLDSITQPSWVETRFRLEDFLKKLTAISITAFCDSCRPQSGMLLIDNVVFEK